MQAQKQIEGADYVIWLIDIYHGTIPQTDIAFIQALGNKPEVFFVLTKADEKPASDIAAILKVTRKDIDAAGLRFAGLIPFSSFEKNDYSLNALDKFVRSKSSVPRDCGIKKKFSAIFERYEAYYDQTIKEGRARLSVLNKVGLHINGGLCPSLDDDDRRLIEGQINSVNKSINITKELLPRFKQLRDKVIERVDRAIGCIEKAQKDVVDTLDAAEQYRIHGEVHTGKIEKKGNRKNEAKSFLIAAALKGNEAALKELVMCLLHKDKFGWDTQSNSYLIKGLKAMKANDKLPEIITRSSLETILELAGDKKFFGSNQGEKE
jgi:hypothetical protein